MSDELHFKMDPHLLWQVITAQAGSLWKAVLEGVMNSIDAGASRCDITIERKEIVIEDDGRGFADRDEVIRLFGTFGLPHKEGDAVYGRFRIGRGQMFTYGINDWLSNGLHMHVDLKPQQGTAGTQGLAYRCEPAERKVEGCRIAIRLYEPLSPTGADELATLLAKAVAWSPVPVAINGKVRSRDPRSAQWTVETEDAYIKVTPSNGVSIYNMGAYVGEENAWRLGAGGVVVSKTALAVNFARNAVLGECKVWRRIRRHFEDSTERKAKRRPTKMNDAERAHTVARFLAGGVAGRDFVRMMVLETGGGAKTSPKDMLDAMASGLCTVAAAGDTRGDRLTTSSAVAVLSDACVAMFGAERACDAFSAMGTRCKGRANPEAEFARLAGRMREATEGQLEAMLPKGEKRLKIKDLTKAEQAGYAIIAAGFQVIDTAFRDVRCGHAWASKTYLPTELRARLKALGPTEPRCLDIGESATCHAWTDGRSYTALNREQLKLAAEGRAGFTRIATLLLHEQLHDEPSTGSHLHDETFYKLFHDTAIDSALIGNAVDAMMTQGMRMAKSGAKKLQGAFAKEADRSAATEDHGQLAI